MTVKTKTSAVVGTADEKALVYPMMRLAQDMHRATILNAADTTTVDDPNPESVVLKVLEEISIELENPYLYTHFRNDLYPTHTFPTPTMITGTSTTESTTTTTGGTTDPNQPIEDPVLSDTSISIAARATLEDLRQMKQRNDVVLQTLEATLQGATESAGDMEVLDAHIALAQYKAKAYGKDDTIAAYETILTLPKVSSGKKIDLFMSVARVTSFYSDITATDDYLTRATTLAEAGGGADWDRRNRLKVYRAIQFLLHRNIQDASKLLLDCISTFNAIEYCTYTEFIVYTILSNLLHLPRPELKKMILDGSEIITIGSEIPEVVRSNC
jgi:26S proteasome subunit RPN7